MLLLYSTLKEEFEQPLQSIGVDFKNEYTKAIDSFEGFPLEHDEKYLALKQIFQKILTDYADTKPKTKGGAFGRFFAKIAAVVVQYIKFK